MLQALGNVGILAFVVATMLALGLRLTLSQIAEPMHGGGLPIKALLASFVLVPALALAIRAVLPLGDAFGVRLMLVATAAGAPFLIGWLLAGADALALPIVARLLGRRVQAREHTT